MPGAMPEILPSEGFGDRTDNDKNIDRCWGCRSMFMQAWGNYGTAWPVVHQQLGVPPDLGRDAVAVVPQVPDGQPRVEGSDIRLGRGSIDVLASRAGKQYTTRVNAGDTPARVADPRRRAACGVRAALRAARRARSCPTTPCARRTAGSR